MRCPFCGCGVFIVPTAELFIIENNILREPTAVVYDEQLLHYECENGHLFFAYSKERAEVNAYSQQASREHNKQRKGLLV